MITYDRSAFGLNLIFRVHGSAVYRSVLPSLFSVAIYCLAHFRYQAGWFPYHEEQEQDSGHPYAFGVLVSSITFLIVFRASQGYARYWEGAGAVHSMMSKWLDASIHAGVYHLQCDHYKSIKPPSYFEYPELNHMFLTRDRERGAAFYDQEYGDSDCWAEDHDPFMTSRTLRDGVLEDQRTSEGSPFAKLSAGLEAKKIERKIHKMKRREQLDRAKVKSINSLNTSTETPRKRPARLGDISEAATEIHESSTSSGGFDEKFFEEFLDNSEREYGDKPIPLVGRPQLDGNWSNFYRGDRQVFVAEAKNSPNFPHGFGTIGGGRTPPLFLQELAHLSSLLVAVALSTLRNDLEGYESPLSFFKPGQPWPEVDPDKDAMVKLAGKQHRFRALFTFLGKGLSAEERTLYNASRPLPVVGGVSDAEIQFLQMARGPYAKTQLCWNWLSEFLVREHLAGSMGDVGPPIVSRCFQFLGDGMMFYNSARKIMFIPFPFPHAQLSVMFILVLVPCIPVLMDQYVDEPWLAATLTFLTVMCLGSIHEVARELENPFRNVPNELPVVTFQAHYNEALITMYSGWHPDQFWDAERILRHQKVRSPRSSPKRSDGGGTSHQGTSKQDAEIAELKRELAVQAKLIEKLLIRKEEQQMGPGTATRSNSDP